MFLWTELQLLWSVTAGILLILSVIVAVAALRTGGRALAVICLLGLAILILGGVLLFQGFTIPGVSFDRVQLIVADIAVMVTAIIVGAIVAVLVMKGGRRRFAP